MENSGRRLLSALTTASEPVASYVGTFAAAYAETTSPMQASDPPPPVYKQEFPSNAEPRNVPAPPPPTSAPSTSSSAPVGSSKAVSSNDKPRRESRWNQNIAAFDSIDQTEDWQHCMVCDSKFTTQQSYQVHCRGIMHTQKVLALEKSAGLIAEPVKPIREPEPVSETLKMKYGVDPNKRDLGPDDVGGKTFDERFTCSLCNVVSTSEATLQTHLEGKRHAKAVKLLVSTDLAKPSAEKTRKLAETGGTAKIEERLMQAKEPLIGLQYIVEYVSPCSEPKYVCNLCQAKCDPRTLISHIVGYKHRLNYLKEIRSDMFAEVQMYQDDKKTQMVMMVQKAQEIEAIDGRKGLVKQRMEIMDRGSFDLGPDADCPLWKSTRQNVNVPPSRRRPSPSPSPVEMKRPRAAEETGEESTPALPPSTVKALLSALAKSAVKNDEDAEIAYQISNALTQALLRYRLDKAKARRVGEEVPMDGSPTRPNPGQVYGAAKLPPDSYSQSESNHFAISSSGPNSSYENYGMGSARPLHPNSNSYGAARNPPPVAFHNFQKAPGWEEPYGNYPSSYGETYPSERSRFSQRAPAQAPPLPVYPQGNFSPSESDASPGDFRRPNVPVRSRGRGLLDADGPNPFQTEFSGPRKLGSGYSS